ncbi:hypothetical protein [Treponema denticola]|uniref:hypothetical protein n=1 Tax=Treponema denticola TaxID=158 RepID=UPI0020A3409A|nr:hypothetical protein [Treponema denticola]UTC92230.1 hypothetical protein E4N84_03550 [Treponema denticola]
MEQTHNERYDKLQTEYLKVKGKDKEKEDYFLSEMYLLCKELQKNYILDYCKKKGLRLREEILEDKIEDATLFLISKYLYKENFKIDKLSAYAYFGFKKAMFKDKDIEMNTQSLDALIEEGLWQ